MYRAESAEKKVISRASPESCDARTSPMSVLKSARTSSRFTNASENQ